MSTPSTEARQGRRSRKFDGPLSADAITATALDIVRSEGLDALTMRRLAAELRTAPMSVYRHMAARDDVLLAMLDAVADDVVLPPVSTDPKKEIRTVMTAIREALREDAWAVTLIAVNKLASTRILPAIERVYAAFRTAGLSAADADASYRLLWQYIVGELVDNGGTSDDDYRKMMVHNSSGDDYPAMHRTMSELGERDDDARFQRNLELILTSLLG